MHVGRKLPHLDDAPRVPLAPASAPPAPVGGLDWAPAALNSKHWAVRSAWAMAPGRQGAWMSGDGRPPAAQESRRCSNATPRAGGCRLPISDRLGPT